MLEIADEDNEYDGKAGEDESKNNVGKMRKAGELGKVTTGKKVRKKDAGVRGIVKSAKGRGEHRDKGITNSLSDDSDFM